MARPPQRKARRNPLIAIVGPTSSGKSDLAVRLALHLNGEIVSADSRQVYRVLDIGSGKISREEMRGVPHHLLDAASPRRMFTVAEYQRLAYKAIAGILNRDRFPILAGGSPQYVYAVTDRLSIPGIPPNPALREALAEKPADELAALLREKDPRRASALDPANKRRLVRALEIIEETGGPVPLPAYVPAPFDDVLFLGITRTQEHLRRRIARRLAARLRGGMLDEVRGLRQKGVSFKRLEGFGMEYRYAAWYLQGMIEKKEMEDLILRSSFSLARRQEARFRKDARVHWISGTAGALRLARSFLGSFPQ